MTQNPFVNAVAAWGYIVAVVAVMNYVTSTLGDKPDSVMAPVIVLSMLTLSVAVMALLFFYQPLQFLLDKQPQRGLSLLSRTIGVFAAVTVLSLALLFFGMI